MFSVGDPGDSPLYTGMKQDRKTHKSAAGTVVNSAYYGEGGAGAFQPPKINVKTVKPL